MVINSLPIGYFGIPGIKFPEEIFVPKNIDADTVFFHVSEYFKISKSDIIKISRKRKYLYPRQVCIYILGMYSTYSLQQIADLFPSNSKIGTLEHSTVIHTKSLIKNLMDTEDQVSHDVKAIKELITYGITSKTIKDIK